MKQKQAIKKFERIWALGKRKAISFWEINKLLEENSNKQKKEKRIHNVLA